MGHERLGFLPRTKQWNAIVELLSSFEGEPSSVAQIANDTLIAIKKLYKLTNGKMFVLETKGQVSRQVMEKRKALEEWIAAANNLGENGDWRCDTSYNIADVEGIIKKNSDSSLEYE